LLYSAKPKLLPDCMTPLTAPFRYNLHDVLVSTIREMVVAGELRPGDKIPERELCRRFEVSRTPLREALKVLAAEGILQLLPRRGAIVARVSAEEIDELFPVMGALEALAGELICKRATDAEIARLRELHEHMMRAYEAGAEPEYLQANRTFHETLVALAGNATLLSTYMHILMRTRAFRFVARKSPENWQTAVADHEKIMEALTARNGGRLARLLRRHVLGVTVKIARDALAATAEPIPRAARLVRSGRERQIGPPSRE
jgi:DNA-binding GntR family transcriptional regulator